MLWLSLIFLLNAKPEFSCRWGEKSDLQIPDCGFPVRLRIQFPDETKGRLEFRRSENPGLSAYLHKKRDGQGVPKAFLNLVNLFKVDLYFCPRDFVTPRTLIFHHVGITQPKDYQCQLGPFSEGDAEETPPPMMKEGETPSQSLSAGVAPTEGTMTAISPSGAMTTSVVTPEVQDVTSGIVPPPRWPVTFEDTLARMLAVIAIIFAVLAILLWAVFAVRMARRMRKLMAQSAPVLSLTESDKRSSEE